MNLPELLRDEMQLFILIGIPATVFASLAFAGWIATNPKKPRQPKGPHIALDSPCPACGNIGCVLAYDPEKKCVKRKCVHCGCVLQQPPIAPALFSTEKK